MNTPFEYRGRFQPLYVEVLPDDAPGCFAAPSSRGYESARQAYAAIETVCELLCRRNVAPECIYIFIGAPDDSTETAFKATDLYDYHLQWRGDFPSFRGDGEPKALVICRMATVQAVQEAGDPLRRGGLIGQHAKITWAAYRNLWKEAMGDAETVAGEIQPAPLPPELSERLRKCMTPHHLRRAGHLPEFSGRLPESMKAAAHQKRYRRTGATFRDEARLKEAKACRRVMPTEYSFDDNWMLIAEGTRRLGRIRQVVIHAVLRYPWLTLLAGCWLALYGLAKLCIWILLHF